MGEFNSRVMAFEVKSADRPERVLAYAAVAVSGSNETNVWRVGPGALDSSKFTTEAVDEGFLIETALVGDVERAAKLVAQSLLYYEHEQQRAHQELINHLRKIPEQLARDASGQLADEAEEEHSTEPLEPVNGNGEE